MNSTADVWGSREGVPSPPPHGDLPRQKAGGSSIMHQLLKISHALSLALSPSAYLSLSSPLFGSLSVSLSVFLFLYLLSIYHKSIIGSPAHCWGWVARRCPPPKKKKFGGWVGSKKQGFASSGSTRLQILGDKTRGLGCLAHLCPGQTPEHVLCMLACLSQKQM